MFVTRHVSDRCLGNDEAFVLGVVKARSSPSSLPIRDVTLTLNGLSDCLEVTHTNAVGFYRLHGPATGTYTVTPTKPGCEFDLAEQTVNLMRRAVLVGFTGTCW